MTEDEVRRQMDAGTIIEFEWVVPDPGFVGVLLLGKSAPPKAVGAGIPRRERLKYKAAEARRQGRSLYHVSFIEMPWQLACGGGPEYEDEDRIVAAELFDTIEELFAYLSQEGYTVSTLREWKDACRQEIRARFEGADPQ